jgi:Immunity protein Imm1
MVSMSVVADGAERVIDDPTPEAVTDAVQALDGAMTTEVYLHASTGRWMGLAAGPERVFVGFSESAEGPLRQAVVADASGGIATVVIGGQRTSIEAKYLLPAPVAAALAAEFARTGTRPLTVEWETR